MRGPEGARAARHGNIIRFAPPLVITREELDHALGIIREVFLAID
jgi:4-aminobutyrate aminotransferase-like enzyme